MEIRTDIYCVTVSTYGFFYYVTISSEINKNYRNNNKNNKKLVIRRK